MSLEGIWPDITLAGNSAKSLGNKVITNNFGELTVPFNSDGLLYLRTTDAGGFKIAGQLHSGPLVDHAATWDSATGEWTDAGLAYGVSPVEWDNNGILQRSGGQGIRYIDENNKIITGDDTYASGTLELSEFTTRGDVSIGMSRISDDGGKNQRDWCVAVTPSGRFVLEAVPVRGIRFHRSGDRLAVAYWTNAQPHEAITKIVTVAELEALPVEPPATVSSAKDYELRPLSDPQTSGVIPDTLEYILGHPSLWPRTGTHPAQQVDYPDFNAVRFVKFGNPGTHETWRWDDVYIYHHEDCSVLESSYKFSDGRWMRRNWRINEKLVLPDNRIQHYSSRPACTLGASGNFPYETWLEAYYPKYWCGQDLGEREVIVFVYDNTWGFRSADRLIEKFYFAKGAGWVRWEAYRSDTGERVARSDAQILGGPSVVPLDGCVPLSKIQKPKGLPEPKLGYLTRDRQIFRKNGQPWRYMGVTAFKLARLFADGADINPFLNAFKGFNTLRVFPYVPAKDWNEQAWSSPTPEQMLAFVKYVGERGWITEITLLTDDDPARVPEAEAILLALSKAEVDNVLIELVNEPLTHSKTHPSILRKAAENSGFMFSSGIYEESAQFFGHYLTAHTPRDSEWPRKAHDLLEYYNGGGPHTPADPAHKVPCVADEPIRPDQAGFNEGDYIAYFATASLLGAGATFHFESGKYGNLPAPEEARCAAAALKGLTAFPADAPLGPYNRIDEHGATLRTYQVGPHVVRIRPLDGIILPGHEDEGMTKPPYDDMKTLASNIREAYRAGALGRTQEDVPLMTAFHLFYGWAWEGRTKEQLIEEAKLRGDGLLPE